MVGSTTGVLRVDELRLAGDLPVDRLRDRLREISRLGYVPSLRAGDTGIGFTLETMLGIAANSSMKPDWETIELEGRAVQQASGLQASIQ